MERKMGAVPFLESPARSSLDTGALQVRQEA